MPNGVNINTGSAANGSGTTVDGIAEVLALSPEESLGTKAGVGTLGIFADTLAKPVRSGSFRFDGCDDGLIALLVNDRLDNTFALLLGFEPTAVNVVAEVLPLDSKIGCKGPVATCKCWMHTLGDLNASST